MNYVPLVLDVPSGAGLFGRAFQDSGHCVVNGPELFFDQNMIGWRPPAGKFDGIVGGPPCQVHSTAARIAGTNAVDLIPEWIEIVAAARPTWFLMENVPQAPAPDLAGYIKASYLLNRLSLGVAKRRRRRFTFGVSVDALSFPVETVQNWLAAMDGVLPKDQWPKQWFPTHPLDPPRADCDGLFKVPPQPALCACDCRGSRNIERSDGGMEGLVGWLKHDLQPALIASEGRSNNHAKAGIKDRNKRCATGLSGWFGKVITVDMAWGHMELPGVPPPSFTPDTPDKPVKGQIFTKAGAIRLLGNGVPYDMGRHVARAVCLALGMADPGRVVREPAGAETNCILEEVSR